MKTAIMLIGLVFASKISYAQESLDSLKYKRDTIGGLSNSDIEDLRKIISTSSFLKIVNP